MGACAFVSRRTQSAGRPFSEFLCHFLVYSMVMGAVFLLTVLCLLCVTNFSEAHDHEQLHNEDAHGKGEDEEHGKEFDVGGVYCKAVGHSGKIMCARPHFGEKRDFTDRNKERIIIEFDSLQERSRGGITVGKVGRKGHMFDEFSKQDFNFTGLSAGTYQGLRVKNFNFSSSLPGPNASFVVMAYMFEENGNVTFGNETSEMRKGMLKFNIQIEDWKFCANDSREDCNSGDEGEFLDVSVVIKSKGKPKAHTEEEIEKGTVKFGKKRRPRCFKKQKYNKCPKGFDVGGGSEMVLSTQVMVDDKIQEMPGNGDYPKFMEKNNKRKFIFRFPKASKRIFYDPGLEVGDDLSEVNSLPQSLAVLMLINCFAFVFSF